MKTATLVLAVFGVWAVLIALHGWLRPHKKQRWGQMEEMMNDGCQTSILLLSLGLLSIAIVLVGAGAFKFL